MPQLDTTTWFVTIVSMYVTLFILFQIKLSNFTYPLNMTPISPSTSNFTTPWETKWTKTYLPLSLPLQ
ncbi:ATP synthase F0 subunit 8 (mitochondrion) [Trichechus manatus]|uniref:ATP synthase complex subunit 8 n=2 Tax=Trichechus manatus TaxID=9778 RepID=A0A2Y9THM8_TRIMA|nr:ATP synthase F0 subunit 8 [Trichechus manatus]QGN66503.1 ATP synthase F0 subunit 8 [Trichechus manatus latirostris]QUB07231.1 ATP synthase F0 subunit 8 [Trichechus senegalensis]QUB07244.1 ATP synthase F0 subunit 8 [Trichechus manatus manatus]CAP17672.1 ATPase subunit 8 [Trichechus manatus]